MGINMYNFQKSYIKWLTHDNVEGIFKISSILEVFEKNKKVEKYILGNLVLAGRMFKKNILVSRPEYTFQIIVSNEFNLIRRVNNNGLFNYKKANSRIEKNNLRFKNLTSNLIYSKDKKHSKPSRDAESNSKIILSKKIGSNKINSYSPLKHWNFKGKNSWQIETGPILWIDERKESKNISLRSLSICFIHANKNTIGTFSFDFPSLSTKQKPYISELKIGFFH